MVARSFLGNFDPLFSALAQGSVLPTIASDFDLSRALGVSRDELKLLHSASHAVN